MRVPRPRTLRGRLLAIVAGTTLAALAVGVVAFNIYLRQSLLGDAGNAAREHAEAAALRVAEDPAHDTAVAEAARGGIWISYGGLLTRPAGTSAALDAAARALAAGSARTLEASGERSMLASAEIRVDDRRAGTAVASVALRPYEHTERLALVGSIGLALTMLALVVLIAYWALRAALRPIDEMAHAAASWSADGSDRRFPEGGGGEVGGLAAMLNQMLDRMQASLRHERRLTAEVSHELRTPLARMTAEADVALARERDAHDYREAIAGMRAGALRMNRSVEALLAAARKEAGAGLGTCDAAEAARRVAVHALPPDPTGELVEVMAPQGPVRVGIEAVVLERILGPLVENALRHGMAPVGIEVATSGSGVRILVSDHGAGVPEAEREEIFEPGGRGAGAVPGGAGLGLALSRRLARAASGDVRALPGPGGRFEVRLPRA